MRKLILIGVIIFFAQYSTAQVVFNFKVEKQTLTESIRKLSEVSHTPIAYNPQILNSQKPITLRLTNVTADQVLNKLLERTDIGYRQKANRIILYRIKPETHALSGYIADAETGERLIAASVYLPELKVGARTNNYGFYSLNLPAGSHELIFNYSGYKRITKIIEVKGEKWQNVELIPDLNMEEVIIASDRDGTKDALFSEIGVRNISTELMSSSPALVGEEDLFHQIQMQPGVQTGADGFGGIHVRGGDHSQNLFLLDGVPVYNPSHLLGFFSIFNSNAVRSANLHSGGFSAKHGGRLASVMEVYTKDGNQKDWKAEIGLGLLSGNAHIEGPFKRDKGAILLSARSTMFEPFLKPTLRRIFDGPDDEQLRFSFHDINAKINYSFSDKDRLYLSYYRGGDIMDREFVEFNEEGALEYNNRFLNWGNQIFAARWNHLFSSKLFSNLTLTFSQYDFLNEELFQEDDEDFEFVERNFYFRAESEIRDFAAKMDFSYYPSFNNRFQFGMGITHHTLTPEFFVIEEEDSLFDEINVIELEEFPDEEFVDVTLNAIEGDVYAEYDFQASPDLKLSLGSRVSFFATEDDFFLIPEPRFQLGYQITDNLLFQASAGRMVQYLHQLGNGLGLPTDLWLPSGDEFEPQRAWQAELGLQYRKGDWRLGIELYVKQMRGLYAFNDSIETLDFTEDFGDEFLSGLGRSIGVELMIQKLLGKTHGFLTYTLSRSERQFNFRNDTFFYPYQYDSRHRLNFLLVHHFSPGLNLSLNWHFASGVPQLTFIENPLDGIEPLTIINLDPQGERNLTRNTPYHHLDFGLNYNFSSQNLKHKIRLGVYNLYNRENTAFYRLRDDSPTERDKVFLMPLLPSFKYSLAF